MKTEIDVRFDKIQKNEDLKNVTKIIFADNNGGFDSSYLTKNNEGFEIDSAYIQAKDVENLNKAIKLAIHLEWHK